MVISYLPTMYQSFRRREAAVAALDVRANTPPPAAALLIRSSIIGGWDRLEELWRQWESWFVDVTETHPSLPALVFFRSPHWEQSWVTASGAVLDGASLLASTWTVRAAPTPSCASGPATSPCDGSPTSSTSGTTPTALA